MKRNDLCEHLTRPARSQLVELLINRLGSKEGLAAEVGVTERAVRKWMSSSTHPSNVNLQKMLELAFQLDEQRTREIIKRDLMNFSDAIEPALEIKHPQNMAGKIADSTS